MPAPPPPLPLGSAGFGWRVGRWVEPASGLAPRWGPRAPRVPVESQAIRLFCCPHLDLFAFIPRKTRQRLAHASPSPCGTPGSGWRAGLWASPASGLAPRWGHEAPRVCVESRAKRASCRPHLEDFTPVPREVTPGAGQCRPPPPRRETRWPGGECAAPRPADEAPRGRVESPAKRHTECYSAVHALKMFHFCTPGLI